MNSNIVRQLFSFLPVLLFSFLLVDIAASKEISKAGRITQVKSNQNNFTSLSDQNYFRSTHLDSVTSDSTSFTSVATGADSAFQQSYSKPFKPSRSPYIVSETINNHSKDITSSYHNYLKIDPAIRGKIVVRILVNHTGSVHDVQIVESSLNNKTFEDSVISQIKAWDDFSSISNNVICAYRQEFQFGE